MSIRQYCRISSLGFDLDIIGNHAGEDPLRRITIYLPPRSEESKQHYPVIYYLHGGLDRLGDSIMMAWFRFSDLMDAGILGDHIHPMIFVLPNSDANLGRGLYTNSTLTGNWADYIAKDVFDYSHWPKTAYYLKISSENRPVHTLF